MTSLSPARRGERGFAPSPMNETEYRGTLRGALFLLPVEGVAIGVQPGC